MWTGKDWTTKASIRYIVNEVVGKKQPLIQRVNDGGSSEGKEQEGK